MSPNTHPILAEYQQQLSFSTNKFVRRYKDSYRVAKTLIVFGTVIKVLGVVKGLLIFFFSIFTWLLGIGLAAQTNPSLGAGAGVFGFLFVIIGIVVGVLSGTILFILGILISALGQNLLAMLDVAVHTSPFLTTEEKSQALS